ncbi:MAG: GNAT family N-acetyltransferase [Bacteroidia bacterium]|nr:GNAT family N-acetyltransferase [Bacteroidia bacterium]
MELEFKKASKADAEVIANLADKIWRKYYIDIISIEQIEYMLRKMYSIESLTQQMDNGHQFMIAYKKGLPVAYISTSSADSKNYFLHKFYVDTDLQREGVGSQLFECVLSDIQSAETIELTVNRQNYKAINFYFKNGFKIKEVADFDIGNGYFMNDFIMIKQLK